MIIAVDGITGSGKTTFIKHLAKILNATYMLEPVDKWQKDNLLGDYYEDASRWAFTFQLNAIIDKMNSKYDMDNDDIIITERSVYSDRCFMEMFFDQKKITSVEYELYTKIWNSLEKNMTDVPDIIIYLNPSVDDSMDRIKKRGRVEEVNLTRKSQQDMADLHDKYFSGDCMTLNNRSIPIVKFTNDTNITTDVQFEKEVVHEVNKIRW
jgi:deoxyadenosine/deoxycytidine kinase